MENKENLLNAANGENIKNDDLVKKFGENLAISDGNIQATEQSK